MERDPTIAQLERAAWEIAESAFEDIKRRYGKDGERPLDYHNDEHAKDITSSTTAIVKLAIQRGILTPEDAVVVPIATSKHDSDQDSPRGIREKVSSQQAQAEISRKGCFGERHFKLVDRMIVGTSVEFVDGRLIQAAPVGDMSNSPEDYLVQATADGDVSNLGDFRDIFWKNSTNYFFETYGPEPTVQNEVEFMTNQVVLLETHEFFTEEARVLFPHQQENLDFARDVLEFTLARAT